MNPIDVHMLPVTEKLQLVTELWDEIASSGEPLSLPAEILQEAHRRLEELKLNPEIAINSQELWRRVNG